MNEHLGYESYERSDSDNYHNVSSKKNVRGLTGIKEAIETAFPKTEY